jgi:hypothetical protein
MAVVERMVLICNRVLNKKSETTKKTEDQAVGVQNDKAVLVARFSLAHCSCPRDALARSGGRRGFLNAHLFYF